MNRKNNDMNMFIQNKETKDDGDQTSKSGGVKLTFIEPHLDNAPLISFFPSHSIYMFD